MEDRVKEFRPSIRNLPRHVFGDHTNCAWVHPFCNGPTPNEKNWINILQQWNYLEEIYVPIDRLVRNAESLILNNDTSIFESLNNVIAEKIGGKRVNFAYRGS